MKTEVKRIGGSSFNPSGKECVVRLLNSLFVELGRENERLLDFFRAFNDRRLTDSPHCLHRVSFMLVGTTAKTK